MKQLYKPITLHQLFTRSQLTIFILTFTICSAIFLVISTYTMNAYAKSSLKILTATLNERVQPAVVFNDQITMNQILTEYVQQYPIRSIEISSLQNQVLAHAKQSNFTYFSSQSFLDYVFYHQPIRMEIRHDQKLYGNLMVYGNSSELVSFFHKILLALLIGFLLLLVAVYWSVNSVYQYLMQSVQSIVESARTISIKKNYNLRVSSSDIQELQVLSTAFNGLLSEIEQSNQNLISENDKLIHQSKHDLLTLLPNRCYFYEVLFKLFESPQPQNAAIIFLNINQFSKVNTEFGRLTGDAVLRASSYCIKQILPSNAFFSRLGADEFALIIPDVTNTVEIESHCQRIQECFTSTFVYEQHQISLNINMGIALVQLAKTPEDLIASVDHALSKAKKLNEKWYISPQSKQTIGSTC